MQDINIFIMSRETDPFPIRFDLDYPFRSIEIKMLNGLFYTLAVTS